jgi:glycosyltransferase involved in cell wall biosynthesis
MRIGIIPYLNPAAGGLHQYSLTMLAALGDISAHQPQHQYVLLTRPGSLPHLDGYLPDHWEQASLDIPLASWKRLALSLLSPLGERRLRSLRLQKCHISSQSDPEKAAGIDRIQMRPAYHTRLLEEKVDWVIYTAPEPLSFEIGLPYIMPIHDLQHRLQPEFPEVSANGEWELREYLYRNGTRYATLILADSETGKEDVLNLYGNYGITPERVKVLPFLPTVYLPVRVSENERQALRRAYSLPERYVFYPAQFWPHKNHLRLVQALAVLKEQQEIEVHLVSSGALPDPIRQETYQQVIATAGQLGVADQVHSLGYVPDKFMAALYAEAVGLVMPTFFGPTNIPVLEAWAYDCPVITSDLRGIRQQVGEAGLLIDPRSPQDIADAIFRLWIDEGLRRELAQRGRQRLAQYGPAEYRQRLEAIVEEACEQVQATRPLGF